MWKGETNISLVDRSGRVWLHLVADVVVSWRGAERGTLASVQLGWMTGACGDDECGSACLGRPPNKWEDHSSFVRAGWQLQMEDLAPVQSTSDGFDLLSERSSWVWKEGPVHLFCREERAGVELSPAWPLHLSGDEFCLWKNERLVILWSQLVGRRPSFLNGNSTSRRSGTKNWPSCV